MHKAALSPASRLRGPGPVSGIPCLETLPGKLPPRPLLRCPFLQEALLNRPAPGLTPGPQNPAQSRPLAGARRQPLSQPMSEHVPLLSHPGRRGQQGPPNPLLHSAPADLSGGREQGRRRGRRGLEPGLLLSLETTGLCRGRGQGLASQGKATHVAGGPASPAQAASCTPPPPREGPAGTGRAGEPGAALDGPTTNTSISRPGLGGGGGGKGLDPQTHSPSRPGTCLSSRQKAR